MNQISLTTRSALTGFQASCYPHHRSQSALGETNWLLRVSGYNLTLNPYLVIQMGHHHGPVSYTHLIHPYQQGFQVTHIVLLFLYPFNSSIRSLSYCARVFGVEGVLGRLLAYSRKMVLTWDETLDSWDACNSLGSLGETFGATLQWSGRNPMAPVSGCPWWCPICITSSGSSSSGSSRGIHHKCKHPLNLTKLYVSG
ncbi:hypothetical protein DEO72_LG4g2396 [Vigna unguiculata]|uniref:Uncharacterized protein n=1 Tax=Vigna unguiculata TaxID=3917 RepID=A0A4D6LSF5_VIGUN|nr:hypothetical protein DEO72_LG4g2396 [Vigna unguiculata]